MKAKNKFYPHLKSLLLLLFALPYVSILGQPDRNNTTELKAVVTNINSTQTQVQICWRNTSPASIGHQAL